MTFVVNDMYFCNIFLLHHNVSRYLYLKFRLGCVGPKGCLPISFIHHINHYSKVFESLTYCFCHLIVMTMSKQVLPHYYACHAHIISHKHLKKDRWPYPISRHDEHDYELKHQECLGSIYNEFTQWRILFGLSKKTLWFFLDHCIHSLYSLIICVSSGDLSKASPNYGVDLLL